MLERARVFSQYLEICRDCRILNGKTQEEIARETGLSVKYVNQIENGRKTPSLESLLTIFAASGMSRNTVATMLEEYLDTFEWQQ